MAALIGLEDQRLTILGKTRPVVEDGDNHVVVPFRNLDPDPVASVPGGVGEQVADDLTQSQWVRPRLLLVGEGSDFNLIATSLMGMSVDDGTEFGLEINKLGMQGQRADVGKGPSQEVFDEVG